jgi:Domain of unknown function (DUF4962)/Heparinase II/III-like protein
MVGNQKLARLLSLITCLILLSSLPFASSLAQDSRELEQEGLTNSKLKGEHPIAQLMRLRNSQLKTELKGVHPRVYVTDQELQRLRERARTTHRELWNETLRDLRALAKDPPLPPAQKRREQNEVGIAIAEAAFVYKIEGDRKYFDAARKFMDAAVSYDTWGYVNNKPNVDLAAGHLLYGLGWGYDLLYHDLSQSERARYREKLIKQARLVAEYFTPKPGRTYAYSQNHTFIPLSGLAVAAYALYDETPEAAEWARLTRAIFDRVLATYSTDGYYYEGFEYWIFSTPWLIHYLDAHAHSTGEDLYERPGFKNMYQYVAHSMLPNGNYVFDFGDIFEGPLTRAGKGEDYKRTHPGGKFHTNYNLLYRLAQRFQDGAALGVAQWLKGFNQVNAESFWSLIWYDNELTPVPIERQQPWHHFADHDVFYWRSDWTTNATAFAFKCGPPEGHHTTSLLQQFPDWRLSSGHAHPDANSFIIFSKGEYLTGDTGYAGVPMTEHHNTVLVNGMGQAKEGKGHDAFANVSYERLNRIKMSNIKVEPDSVVLSGDATAAYEDKLGVKQFIRDLEFRRDGTFTIRDEIDLISPGEIAVVLHADSSIEPVARSQADSSLQHKSAQQFRIKAGKVSLMIEPLQPASVVAAISPNRLIAPGPPGSVDKGERQERGQRLILSTAQPAKSMRFVIRLRIEE